MRPSIKRSAGHANTRSCGAAPLTPQACYVHPMENGDVLIVSKLDRLGRDAMDVRKTVEQLAASGIRVHCLALGGVDLTSAAGKMTMQVISAVAEFEKDLLIERTHSGLARARAAGKRLGRPPALNPDQRRVALEHLKAGASIGAVAREFGTSRQTIMRLRDDAGPPVLPE
ncbi:recombinase family protein [Pantoea agglomerans]|uniref:recombinase family protein n=1 Tax=Enterobacter agglomerans TaxID=549 RepID=UPI00320AD7C1